MRAYTVAIDGGPTWTSFSQDGTETNPGALKLVVDGTVTWQDTPAGGFWIQLWGIGIDVINQTQQFWMKNVTVSLGMAKGLPLAKPQQYGQAASGIIQQTFANWVGVDQTLDIVFSASRNPPPAPSANPNPLTQNQHIVLPFTKGSDLKTVLQQTLTQAFPGQKITMNIGKVVAPQDLTHISHNLEELGLFVRRISQQITGQANGVGIVQNNSEILVDDGSQQSNVVNIAFEDLVGQPTWIQPFRIQFKTVMRADIKVGQNVKLPKTLVLNTQAGQTNFVNQNLAFQGTFNVQSVRYCGDSRSPQGEGWVTIYEALSQQGAVAGGAGANSTGGVTGG